MNILIPACALALTSFCSLSAYAAEPLYAAGTTSPADTGSTDGAGDSVSTGGKGDANRTSGTNGTTVISGITSAPASQPDHALQITPYLWAAELHGHMSPFRRGPTIGVDKSFSDVMDDLRLGGFIDVWGRSGRYVLSADMAYVDTRQTRTSGRLPGIGPVPPGTVLEGRADSKLFMATLLGGYRVVDMPDLTVDALGGLRVWHVSNKLKVSALGRSRSYSESFGWAEPVIGARAFTNLTDKLSVQGLATIGGFGAGSRFAWSAQATLNYAFTDHLSVSAGYKVLDVNYDRKGHVYDTQLRGPVLGLTYRF